MQQLLTNDDQPASFDAALELPRILKGTPAAGQAALPLWLSSEEAELLVTLCFSSVSDGGTGEREFFAKLGRFVRLFSL